MQRLRNDEFRVMNDEQIRNSFSIHHSSFIVHRSVKAVWLARLFDRLILSGLLFTLAVLPLQSFSAEFSIGMCLILLFLWVGQAAVQKRMVIVWTPFHLVLLTFLGIAVLQLVPLPFPVHHINFSQSFKDLPVPLDQWNTITLDKQATTRTAAVLASLIGCFFIAANIIDTEKRLRQVVNWLIFFAFAISLLGVLDGFSPSSDPLLRGHNFLGLYYQSLHRVAGYTEMAFPLPLAMIFAGGARRDEWVWYGFAAIAIGIGVASAGTTGAVLVLVVEIMALFLLMLRQKLNDECRMQNDERIRKSVHHSSFIIHRSSRFGRIWMGLGALVIIGTIIAGVVWLATQSMQMIASDVTRDVEALGQLQEETPYVRAGIWKGSLQIIADHPIIGVGLGAFPFAYTLYDPGPGFRVAHQAHNDYLQVLCDAGFIGGIIMIFFLGLLVHSSRSLSKSEQPLYRAVASGAAIGCLGILVHSLVDFHLQRPGTAAMFLMLIALLVSIERMQRKSD
jgi:O-antigen ligase